MIKQETKNKKKKKKSQRNMTRILLIKEVLIKIIKKLLMIPIKK